jgi:hypothetical protein
MQLERGREHVRGGRLMSDFEDAARNANASLGQELMYFVRHAKKWWLLPVLAIFLIFAGILLLSTTAAAPFIYTLF